MYQRSDIKEGMVVRSIDGEKLGKVFAVGESEFHIEKGLFFPKDYLVRYSEVSRIDGSEIILSHGKEALSRLTDEDRTGAIAGTGGGAGVGPGAVGMGADRTAARASTGMDATSDTVGRKGTYDTGYDTRLGTDARSGAGTDTAVGTRGIHGREEDVTIPLHREEVDVLKRDVQAGEVRVHKDVVEEDREVDVPVRRERVRVERRDVSPGRPAMNASFQEETVVVPLRAEEVEVQKRAVVDEEVVIHKDEVDEQRHISEHVRREEVDIRTEGEEPARTLNAPSDDPLKRGY
ncbi:YsnF/AvaK domain-containing protein [Myxococcus sp. AM009]|uniref:YsnF/AvaK domain-containing protein n=1 Tax=unclassified Myxococcus TaxID=2648731 RepID=UPI00159587D0|nr:MULTISPECIES: YsnF/AvaK domain-containing protein [unclassified Myxococcus]NVI98389.1 YsnF/AvaK domain-containing protein [Myxococcus sp. AM009]NVJ13327.1 YsnF/AvaK domain-containing protein [Myxococcus sp. AM010]